jgi:hypothetical protein
VLNLRDQAVLLNDMQSRLRDSGQSRWTETELLHCLNQAIEQWHGRVSSTASYEIPGGWVNDQFEIALADWLPDDVQPQAQWPVDPLLPNGTTLSTWKDILTWQVEPAEDGTRTLRLDLVPYNGQVRLLYRVRNGRLPAVIPALSAGITATDASLTVDQPLPMIERTGWMRIGAEWIGYRGVSVGASTTALQNLVRGQHETTAATHDTGDAVLWGVAAPNWALFQQLSDQACAYAHERCLTDGSPKERDLHERMLSYFQGRADMFWRRHTPRAPRWRYT